MSGVAINPGNYVGCHSGSGVVPMSTAENSKNAEPSILASLNSPGSIFRYLTMVEGKQFYIEVVNAVLSCPT